MCNICYSFNILLLLIWILLYSSQRKQNSKYNNNNNNRVISKNEKMKNQKPKRLEVKTLSSQNF